MLSSYLALFALVFAGGAGVPIIGSVAEILVQVDGGVHLGNIASVREAGADLLVSGSGVFWSEDPGGAYRELVASATAVRV